MSAPTCLMCPRPVRFDGKFDSWRRFCGRRCAGKWAAAQLKQRFSHADRVRLGKEGAAVKRESYRLKLLQDLRELPRDEAIIRAYQRGRHAAKVARQQGRATA